MREGRAQSVFIALDYGGTLTFDLPKPLDFDIKAS